MVRIQERGDTVAVNYVRPNGMLYRTPWSQAALAQAWRAVHEQL